MPTIRTRGLIVLSSVAQLPNGRPAGFWLPEAAYPWAALRCSGWDFSFASTAPGQPPMSGADTSDPPQRMFLRDPAVHDLLRATVTADRLDPADFGAVFVAGGHGAVFDLPGDSRLIGFLEAYAAAGGVLAATCHGVGALLGLRSPGGEPLVRGRRVTAFTKEEDRAVGLAGVVPCFLDDALRERGARYEAGEPFRSHVVADGTLVTGQNPASIAGLVETAMELALGHGLPAGWPRRAPRLTV